MWLLLGSLVVIFTLVTPDNDSIVFPTEDNAPSAFNGESVPQIQERLPILIPGACPPNMLSYPGDGNSSSWVCDCNAGWLYFPLNNSCHEPYRQGPCPPGNYVVLAVGEVVPKCETNPCLDDGKVSFENGCYELNSLEGPCTKPKLLMVNDTFQLECLPEKVVKNHIIDAPPNRCPAGSRRNALNQCRKMI